MRFSTRIAHALAVGALLALGACSVAGGGQQGSAEADLSAPVEGNGSNGNATTEAFVPRQLSYSYGLSFLIPADRMDTVISAHRAACAQLGPRDCQLLALDQGEGKGRRTAYALMTLRVASARAEAFSDRLKAQVAEAGGSTTSTKVDAHDVSTQIVDTNAHIAQQELYVARLTEVLRSRTGSMDEVVTAERNLAEAQQQLEQARGSLNALRGRVSMSDISIQYISQSSISSGDGFGQTLLNSAYYSLDTFLAGLRLILILLLYLLPWLVLGTLIVLAIRAIGRARRKREEGYDPEAQTPSEPIVSTPPAPSPALPPSLTPPPAPTTPPEEGQ